MMEGRAGESRKAHGSDDLYNSKQTLSQTRWEAKTNTYGHHINLTYMLLYVMLPSTHMNGYTHTHTKEGKIGRRKRQVGWRENR